MNCEVLLHLDETAGETDDQIEGASANTGLEQLIGSRDNDTVPKQLIGGSGDDTDPKQPVGGATEDEDGTLLKHR